MKSRITALTRRRALTVCAAIAVLAGCGGGSSNPMGSTGLPIAQNVVSGTRGAQNIVPLTQTLVNVTIFNKKPRCTKPFHGALILLSRGGYYLIHCFITCEKNPDAKLVGGTPRLTGPGGKVSLFGFPVHESIYYQAVSIKGNCNNLNCQVDLREKVFGPGKVPPVIDSCLTLFS